MYSSFALYLRFQPQHTNRKDQCCRQFSVILFHSPATCGGRESSCHSGTSVDIRKYRVIMQSLGEGNESWASYGTSDIWILMIYLVMR